MTFQETINNSNELLAFILFALLFVGGAALGFATLCAIVRVFGKNKDKSSEELKKKILCAAFTPFLAFGAVFLLISGYNVGDKYHDTEPYEKALSHNIMEKYNVDDIVLDMKGSVVNPQMTDPQPIIVEVDGQQYQFILTQNEETFEPTLKNPPIPGGTAPTGISADDLLKNKKD